MSVAGFLADLRRLGIMLREDGGQLRFRSPEGVLTPGLRTELGERKREILDFLQQQDAVTPPATLPEITPDRRDRNCPFPLTDIQQAYWVGRTGKFALGNVACHGYYEIDTKNLDLKQFERAWQQLVERHDMLRAVFLPDGRQQILQNLPVYEIEVLDLRAKNTSQVDAELQAIRERMSHQVMDTENWPLFEIRASRVTDTRLRLHMSFDLLILDLWSRRILFDEWLALYRNPQADLEPLELSFRDYVLAERSLRQSDLYLRSRDYWWQRLSTLPLAPDLPMVKDPGQIEHPRYIRWTRKLPADSWDILKMRVTQSGLTASGVLATALAEVLKVWSQQPKFILNLTLFNRLGLHPQVNRIIGDFTSVTLLEIDTVTETTFAGRAARVQQQLWNDLDHRFITGVEVLREMAKCQGHIPRAMPVVFTSGIVHDARKSSGQESSYWMGDVVYSSLQTPQVWLDVQALEDAGELVINWIVVDELFPDGFMHTVFDIYGQLLERLVDDRAWEDDWQTVVADLVSPRQLAYKEMGRSFGLEVPAREQRGDSTDQGEFDPGTRIPAVGVTMQITEIVSGILDLKRVAPEENLLNLGATSIDMIRIANQLDRELGFRPEMDAFYQFPSVMGLARIYEAQEQNAADSHTQSPQVPVATAAVLVDSLPLLLDPDERRQFKQSRPGLRRNSKDRPSYQLDPVQTSDSLTARCARRRSYRHFSPHAIPGGTIGELLNCLRKVQLNEQSKFLYASAGGLYPVQVYLYLKPGRIEGFPGGSYYHDPQNHHLVQLVTGKEIDPLAYDPLVNRPVFHEAAFAIFLIAQLKAIVPLYGERSQHYATIETGLMTQLLELAACDHGLGLCQIGDLDFSRISDLFALDEGHVLLHSLLGGAIDQQNTAAWASFQEVYATGVLPDGDREEGEI